jgi:hypothetical protein
MAGRRSVPVTSADTVVKTTNLTSIRLIGAGFSRILGERESTENPAEAGSHV